MHQRYAHGANARRTDPRNCPRVVKFDRAIPRLAGVGEQCGILPWYVYEWYGDKQVLADNYDMMKRYLAYLGKKAKDHIFTQGLGDWYDLGPAHPGVSQLTPKELPPRPCIIMI
jgi:alpha-L-rhamnosidase